MFTFFIFLCSVVVLYVFHVPVIFIHFFLPPSLMLVSCSADDGRVNNTEFLTRQGCIFGSSLQFSRFLWDKVNPQHNDTIEVSQVIQLLNGKYCTSRDQWRHSLSQSVTSRHVFPATTCFFSETQEAEILQEHWHSLIHANFHPHSQSSIKQYFTESEKNGEWGQTDDRKKEKKRKILISLCPLFTRNWPTGGRLSKVYFSGRCLYCDWLIIFTYLQTLLSSLVLFPFNSIRKPLLLFNPNNLIVSD